MSDARSGAAEGGAEVTPDAIMELGSAFWGSKALLSAVELGVFSELADAGPLDGEALRERLGLHPRSATDFFDALVALGMLERENGHYANTPATELFLDPDQAHLCRRHPGDVQRPPLWVLGLTDGGPSDRSAAERGEERRELLRGALRRPGTARAICRAR